MKIKPTLKRVIDLIMLLLLPILMAEILTGQEVHEWLGVGMALCFILHLALNASWFQNLFKGSYFPARCLQTAVNLFLCADILALLISGIMMSGFVFSWLKVSGGMILARQLHLFASYWGLILISAHLGVNWSVMLSAGKKLLHIKKDNAARTWVLRILAIAVSAYGIYAVIAQKLYQYLFLQTHFVLFDETKSVFVFLIETVAMMVLFAAVFYALQKCISKIKCSEKAKQALKWVTFTLALAVCAAVVISFSAGQPSVPSWGGTESSSPIQLNHTSQTQPSESLGPNDETVDANDSFILIKGGSFQMGSPETEGLTPVYAVNGSSVTWDRSANGYRLPTEAEWEYACRAGTITPFNTENSPSAEEVNYYGHYPYEIEGNYFSQDNLETKPGEYRQTTVAVDSFSPNKWGLYNMHGNVSEWVWDYYGAYSTENQIDPTGAESGSRRVYRGGGWNDFAKNMRSAYRATLAQDQGSFNIGIRLVRNAQAGNGTVSGTDNQQISDGSGKVLIVYFSWGGNTEGVAEEIRRQTGADLFEIELVHPYSDSYNTVLDQALHDQNIGARPEIKNKVENFDQYDTILIGYPNWWASIPMPIASFLEEYDFSGKTIIPFCSHGGGRFGQSLTAIAKLAPDARMGEGLSIHYSGGSTLGADVEAWLKLNNIQ